MTDLPALESLLVDAASRRRRRRRAKRGVLLVAVAALVAALLPMVTRDVPNDEREVPAATPTPIPNYGVFDRPATAADEMSVRSPKTETRLIATQGKLRAYLERLRNGQYCLLTTVGKQAQTRGCAELSDRPLGLIGNGLLIFAVPDSIREVTIGDKRYPIQTNGLIANVPAGPVTVRWPGGKFDYPGNAITQPTDLYAVFKRPEQPEDRLDGLPGARRLLARDRVSVFLAPRKGEVCLIVKTVDAGREDTRAGCRPGIVHSPLVVAAPHLPQHVIAAVFPDGTTPNWATATGNFVFIPNGEEVTQLSYTDPTGRTRTDRFPKGAAAFVLGGDAVDLHEP